MKNNLINNIINCPVLFYSNFTKEDEVKLGGTVSINRFKNDIEYFISAGYRFYSINELHDIIDNDGTVEEKSLCLAFIDGFESEYTLAFDVVRHYGIHVDIFIDPNKVGVESDSGINRFNWDQARSMCESGLVSIQGFYGDLSRGNIYNVVPKIISCIKEIFGSKNGSSFLNSIGDTITVNSLKKLDECGIKSQIIFYKQLCMDSINNACFGHISMENSMSVKDFEKSMLEYKRAVFTNASLESNISSNDDVIVKNFLNIKDSIYLDVIEKPVFTNRPSVAFPMSVLGIKDYDVYADFIAMEFISLMAIDRINYMGFDNFDYKTWPMLDTYSIGPDVLRSSNVSPLVFIYEALKNGYCVDVGSDAFYIPGKLYYKSEHISHNILIFGYDANEKMFKTLTHINTGKYTFLDVAPKDLLNSFSTMYFENLTLLRKNNWHRTYFSKYTMKQLLSDYNNSVELTFYSKPYIDFFNSKIVGAKVGEWLHVRIKNGSKIEYSNLKTYIEHKQCMSWRIKYIANKASIDISSFETMLEQLDDCSILLAMAIKYNVSLNVSIKNKIVDKINEINEIEITAISYVLNQL